MLETTITLKPEYIPDGRFTVKRNPAWREGMTVEKLKAELTEKMKQVPGYVPAFLQPIENRVLMLYTGIRAQLGVKIYGDSLDAIQRKAYEVDQIIRSIPGATGVSPSRVQGKPYINIRVDRQAMARYGLSARDVLDTVEVAIGGKDVGVTIEGRERYPIQLRLQQSERDNIDSLGRIPIAVPADMAKPATGEESIPRKTAFIPLGMVAQITRESGANEIPSENGKLRSFVQANVQNRDLGGFVHEVEEHLKSLDWKDMTWSLTGDYENQRRFAKTMELVFPAAMLIIFMLLYIVYHSALEAAHVMLAVPFALSGGVILQKILGYNFNGAVWVGYIALFGTAVQTGVVMVVYLEETVAKRMADPARPSPRRICLPRSSTARACAAPESHDRGHHHRQPIACVMEPSPGSRSHEAARHSGHRRDGFKPVAHPHRHSRHFLWLRTREFRKHTNRLT